MIESRPLPEIARTAAALLAQEHARQLDALGMQTLDVMGVLLSDGWRIDFAAGTVSRERPEQPSGE